MTAFALIRHASHDRLGHTLVGRASGVQLSADGAREAEDLAARLEAGSIHGLYSSPSERARETAAAIADRLHLEVEIADELNEIDFGAWTDRTFADLSDIAEWRRFNDFRSGSRPPNGEATIEVQGRMLRLIERLCARHADETVALVSHGDVIKAALAHYLGVSLDLSGQMRPSARAKRRLAWRAARASSGTPFGTSASSRAPLGQRARCEAETQCRNVFGRVRSKIAGGYHSGGRCSVTSTGGPAGGR
jgi:broad specificity phosphatase PhoE